MEELKAETMYCAGDFITRVSNKDTVLIATDRGGMMEIQPVAGNSVKVKTTFNNELE